jgi:hypothetical protein
MEKRIRMCMLCSWHTVACVVRSFKIPLGIVLLFFIALCSKKRGTAMKIFRSKIALLLISLFAIFFFGVTMSFAEPIKGKRFGTFESKGTVKVGDVKGHTLTVGVSKGVDATNKGIFIAKMISDLINGNGTQRGYTVTIHKDGDKSFSKSQGKVTTVMSEGKMPLVTFEGTWEFTGGTGKWANVQGKGTYKGRFIGPGIFTYDMEGESSMKK